MNDDHAYQQCIHPDCAATFGIEQWPVSAVKAYLGHSIASSAGDQLAASLGIFRHGIIPGILTIDGQADDVSHDRLNFLTRHRTVERQALDAVLINSKGFGGNNASASILAPHRICLATISSCPLTSCRHLPAKVG